MYQKKPFGTWQFSKICILVNFLTQKLKSKHLVCLSFLWWKGFLGEGEKIFCTYFGPELNVTCNSWVKVTNFRRISERRIRPKVVLRKVELSA